MNRSGIVVSTSEDQATVRLLKHTACGDCGACHLGDDSKHITVEAINDLNAKPGDLVEIDLAAPNVLGAAFIMYMIPLAVLVAGVVLGSLLASLIGFSHVKDLIGAVLGLGAMVVVYMQIKKREHTFKASKKYLSKIRSVKPGISTPE